MLRKIAKLIDSTEDGSYIKTAFDGCVQDAEDNITDDAAYSWKDRAQAARRQADEAQQAAKSWEEATEIWKENHRRAKADAERLTEEVKTLKQSNVELWNNFRKAEDEAEALKQQVIELKAKLYDFMIKG